jgi:hypothetical protein
MPPVSARPPALMCVSIDCERDKGARWRVRRPAAFAGVHEGIARRLHPLFRAYGVTPTYLLSPEVLRDAASVDCLARLPGRLELGTHLHAEYVGPDADDEAESTVFQAALPPAIERAKLRALTNLFVERFQRRPRSFRAGRFGIGPASLSILADLGYQVDSSVTPLLDWSRTGAGGPSFRDAPLVPYRPDPARPARRARAGEGSLWEVPVTIRAGWWQRLPAFGRRLPHRWLRPTWGTSRGLVALARRVLQEGAERAERPIVLNVMFHNIEVIAGASPYARDERQADAILERLASLLAFTREAGVRSVGLGDLPELLS